MNIEYWTSCMEAGWAALGIYRARMDEYNEAAIAHRVQDQLMNNDVGCRSFAFWVVAMP
jgi:hypothetical protein